VNFVNFAGFAELKNFTKLVEEDWTHRKDKVETYGKRSSCPPSQPLFLCWAWCL